jgi:2'-hydroxyisoflavone reductase
VKRVVVLGSSGFLGNEIVKTLVQKDIQVVGVSRNHPKLENYSQNHIFSDKKRLKRESLGSVDAVIDVCSYSSSDLALQLAHDCTYVLISTTSVYKKSQEKYSDQSTELDYDSQDIYIKGKIEAELSVLKEHKASLILRPCIIIGPGENTGRTRDLMQQLLEGRVLKTKREPESLIQMIDVRDCADQIAESILLNKRGTLNIVVPPVQLRDFIDAAAKAFNSPQPKITYRSSLDQIPFAKHPYYLSQNSITRKGVEQDSSNYSIETSLTDWSSVHST